MPIQCTNTLKHDAEQQITRKPKETTKYKYKYKTNINTLIGNIKEEMFRLLTDDKEEINIAIQDILNITSKDLVYTKINPQHTKKEKKTNIIIKNANQTSKIAFKKSRKS